MGLNNDYAYDINTEDLDPTEDQDEDDNASVDLDPESWQDWNSEHLLNMYMSLVDYCDAQGLSYMKNVTFNNFCNFIYNRVL